MADKRLPVGTVEPHNHGFRLHASHPQWGGYGAHAFVDFAAQSNNDGADADPGCFDLTIWHDGEFPISEERAEDPDPSQSEPFEVHHCDAGQTVSFGIDVLEAMIAHQKTKDGKPVAVFVETIDGWIARLLAMKGGA